MQSEDDPDALKSPPQAPLALGGDEFRMLVDSVQDYAIFMLDPEGRVASWNPGAQKLKGYRPDEIIGRPLETFYPEPAIRSGWPREELRRAVIDGRFEDEGWRVRKDGTMFWASVVISAVKDDQGRLRGFAKVTRDLTERRRHEEALRRSEEQFRGLVNSVKDYAIFLIDPEGLVRTWNAGASTILGYPAAEIIGQHFSRFFTSQDAQAGRPQRELEVALRDGRAEDQSWRVRRGGEVFWADVVITPVFDASGALRGYAKVTRDLSAQRRLAELEHSSRRMNEFLAMLAHELRNPLAPIRNAVGILRMQPTLPPAVGRMGDIVDRQLTHLTRLVDDLLDVGRIVTGKILLRRERIDFRGVVHASVEAVRPVVAARRHVFTLKMADEPMEMLGDATRLAQSLQNLLNNAARYTPEGGQITLDVRIEGAAVVAAVTDTGRGIAPEALERIFELFVQESAAPAAPSEGGLGIGLSLARSLVEQHGGTLTAHSAGPGQGSTFTLWLPLQRGAAAAPAPSASFEAPAGPEAPCKRVLVVDDNRDSADTMVQLLTLIGHDAQAAYDGPQALRAAERQRPEVVLLDLNMPGQDGFAVLRQLRAQPSGMAMFVAAMTGYGQKADRDGTLAAGFQAHLTKPVGLEPLREVLAAAQRMLA